MPVMGVVRFERFFRAAAGLDVDRSDLKRFDDFVQRVVEDMVLIAQERAHASGRDVIEVADLPITRGLRESIRAFQRMEEAPELMPVLERLAPHPQLDLALSVETEERLPLMVGGLGVALARTFRIIEPHKHNPATAEWERAFAIFDLLL
jgi:hypothetical protein